MTTRPLEIIFVGNAARQDTYDNVSADLDKDIWSYGVMPPKATGFEVEDTAKFWYADFSKNRWNEVLLQDIIDRLEVVAPHTKEYNFKSLSVQAGGKTFGLDGNIHIDKDFDYNSDGDGYMTICYFPQKEWEAEWGGELQFFDDDGNIIATYYPSPNSCVVFDSNIPHRGLAPTRDCDKLRKFVSFKTFVHKGSLSTDATFTEAK
jgi:hypothetical protein